MTPAEVLSDIIGAAVVLSVFPLGMILVGAL